MSRSKGQLEEDRTLRDSARRLFRNELAHVRKEVTLQALGERVADRIGRKVEAASDGALGFVRGHGGAIAATGAAIAAAAGLWLGRKPILARLGLNRPAKTNDATDGGIDEETDDE